MIFHAADLRQAAADGAGAAEWHRDGGGGSRRRGVHRAAVCLAGGAAAQRARHRPGGEKMLNRIAGRAQRGEPAGWSHV